jgi:RimJ/RimL family protein N-acetyltransferase
MTASLTPGEQVAVVGVRTPSTEDIPAIAGLMLAAYTGTIDYEGETLEESVHEIERTFSGEYGPFMPKHSSVVVRQGSLISATLITLWQQRPFVAYSMTVPQFQKQGISRASLQNAMASLHAAGYSQLSLVVTVANEHAHRLYQALGFVQGR